MPDKTAVSASQLLRTSNDRQVNFRWPLAIDQRLDALVDRATGFGDKTNRRELLAALVLTSDFSGEQIGELLRSYRTISVGNAVLDQRKTGNVIEFDSHKPGPRAVS